MKDKTYMEHHKHALIEMLGGWNMNKNKTKHKRLDKSAFRLSAPISPMTKPLMDPAPGKNFKIRFHFSLLLLPIIIMIVLRFLA